MTGMSDHVVTVSLQLRWGDMDVNNHINNVAIARLFEESRVRAGMALLIASGAPPSEDGALIDGGLVVVRQEIEYLASIPYSGDDITSRVWLSRVGTSSFDFGCVLTDPAGAPFAQAETTLVCVDPAGRPVGLGEGVAAAMRDRVEAPVALRSRRP
ncbi:hypothetical protein ASG12_08570 [Williamsia sp. Leaf354]|nr:hypothetical protein ASG12_08570 [Williamsia sp. Leaf354]